MFCAWIDGTLPSVPQTSIPAELDLFGMQKNGLTAGQWSRAGRFGPLGAEKNRPKPSSSTPVQQDLGRF